MRLIFITAIISCLSVSLLFSQERISAGNLKLEEVVRVQSLSQEQLFLKAKSWILETLKPSDNLVYIDAENHRMVATINQLLEDRNTSVSYKVTLAFKDGRYKYTIDRLIYTYVQNWFNMGAVKVSIPLESMKFSERKKAKIYNQINRELRPFVTTMMQSIKNPGKIADW
ncbi:DUF4468 domain-containing protein [Fulvivirgaceae bacterium BMA12]|uniref:DUF4468 domain-containing protein n=1 Tax=Agaribacillus aureus TaxID=3051825 RepID=A0ABT8L576_9BACT|nr:DUF4468 domain-containing protein [Fulvivirgaceae bacterium BMA12]